MLQKIKIFYGRSKKDWNKLFVLLDQGIVSGGNFVLGLVLIRTLGLEIYGLFSLLWMGVLFSLSLHQAFITQPLMTLAIGKTASEQKNYFHTLWQIQFFASLLIIGISLIFIPISLFLETSLSWFVYIPITSALAVSYLLQDFIKKTFFIKKEFLPPLLMDCLAYSLIFGSLFFFHVIEESNLQLTLWSLFFAYFLSSFCFCKALFQKDSEILIPTWAYLLKKHYHFSSWLLGTSIVQWFSGNFFLVAAAGTLGTSAVGAVRMGQNIVGLCHLLFLAMENIVPAEAAQHFLEKGTPALVKYLKDSSLKIGSIVLLILTSMAIAAPYLIEWFYGLAFVQYSFVVWGYCVLYFFVFLGFPVRYFFRTVHFTKPIFIAYCLSAICSVFMAFPMVQHWGIIGLLVGLVLNQLITLFTYYAFNRNYMAWEGLSHSK